MGNGQSIASRPFAAVTGGPGPDRSMIQVGNIIHIEIVDHLIFTMDGYYAFSQKGLKENVRGSKKFVPLYKEQERIRKEAMKLGWADGLKEGKKIGLERGILIKMSANNY